MDIEKEMVSPVRPTDKMFEIKKTLNATHIAMEAFLNLPEGTMCLDCTKWRYGYENPKTLEGDMKPELFHFEFVDHEEYDDNDEPIKHTVKIADAEKGVEKLFELIGAGKLFVGGLTSVDELMDMGNWDAEVTDALVQCSIFGEVIYG